MKITIENLKQLTGGLVTRDGNGRAFDTFKGRILKQLVKNTIFTAINYKDPNADNTPVADSALASLEDTCMPYKEGIDASLTDILEKDLTMQFKPRKDLLLDILAHPESNTDAINKAISELKNECIMEQLAYMSKKNTNIKYSTKLRVGLNAMEQDDGTLDEDFITKAVEFVLSYPSQYPSKEDVSNSSYLEAVLNGVKGEPQDDSFENESVFNFDI